MSIIDVAKKNKTSHQMIVNYHRSLLINSKEKVFNLLVNCISKTLQIKPNVLGNETHLLMDFLTLK